MSRPAVTPHRTPLRRISHGSLFALSRSQNYPDAPHGLGFLEPALSELADETEALQANVEALKALGDALDVFNESFSSYLYAIDMNALTVEWPRAPTDGSYELARRRAAQDAQAALAAIRQQQEAATAASAAADIGNRTSMAETTDIAANTTTTSIGKGPSLGATKVVKKKPGAKPKMSAKERKERGELLEKTVSSLPLEFRGSDPVLRRQMESVIEFLMDSEGKGVRLLDLVKPPDLTQARVNKCLIALVNRKLVAKDNRTGQVLYQWLGVPG